MHNRRRGVVRWREDIGKYMIDYYDDLGKRHREAIGGNEHDAYRELNKKIDEIDTGTFDPAPKTELFKPFTERWLGAKVGIEESTRISYQGILDNHLIPYFGKGRIAEIRRKHIQSFVKEKTGKGDLTAKSIENILRVLHQILEDAEAERLVVRNPYFKIEKPKKVKPPVDYLRTAEIRVFLKACEPAVQGEKVVPIARKRKTEKKATPEKIDLYPLFYTFIFTGMRRGELLARKWADADWFNRKIRVKDSLYKGKLKSPKTEYSKRDIDMGPGLIQVLKEHRAVQDKIKLNAGEKWVENDLIFCRSDGRPLDPDNLYHREFKRTLKKAGLRSIRIHDLRHTFAALLISAGHNVKYIQHQMGHSSIQVTMDLYGHLMPEVHDGAAKRTEDFVFGHAMGTEQKKEVASDSQPLDLIGSGGLI